MERRAIVVQGIVQGVGFRPFVFGLASRLALSGFVKNCAGELVIEIEGPTAALDRFLAELSGQPPPLARIEKLHWERTASQGEHSFRIEISKSQTPESIFVSPDIATCGDCLRELFDPGDRRHRYPFLNCTNCGPRLTIIRGAPYDRQRTTMAGFPMCDACRREYEDPNNRRFHAQPTCCRECGPRLELIDATDREKEQSDPLGRFARAIRQGRIGALKGLGGYHLVCDARSSSAVTELRRRKHREARPFALMVKDVDAARQISLVGPVEADLLVSRPRPIVLLRKREPCVIAEAAAPGNPCLGVMLPYTGLHHLLAGELAGMPLIMTSGNRADEPIATEDDDARKRLSDIADVFLIHDRPIHVRCDDSVVRVVDGQELPIRRSRGYAPYPIALPFPCRSPVLAVGGQLKGTFALGRGGHAFLSHHLGDLDHLAAYQAFERDIQLYESLLAIEPEIIVHDLHPDYASTRYAQKRHVEGTSFAHPKTKLLPVQHHHAHVASCMAENGLTEPVIGLAFDGSGFGLDGAIWGGEFFVGSYQNYRRAAHLRYVGLPGSEAAVRETWRVGLSHAVDAGRTDISLNSRVPSIALRTARALLDRHFNCPMTSSVGRLFDAIASLIGMRNEVDFEGQAAIELESLASEVEDQRTSYPFELAREAASDKAHGCLIIDTRPLIGAVIDDANQNVPASTIARRFQTTMVELIARVCGRIRAESSLGKVVLSGGVFMNSLLTSETCRRLCDDGFQVFRHRLVPPNDGGLSLGQLAIAASLTS
jgi:hydrogenase maturation protein HypF